MESLLRRRRTRAPASNRKKSRNTPMLNCKKGRSIMKSAFSIVVCLIVGGFCQLALAQAPQPQFKVDPYWPKELPNNWIIGQVGGMYADSNDHIWVFQRPRSNTPDEISADPSSPRHAMCCFPAPPVLEFDTEGNLLKSWGGPSQGYDWPTVEHGIFVDRSGNVWLTGSGVGDRQVLKFTSDGNSSSRSAIPPRNPPTVWIPLCSASPPGWKWTKPRTSCTSPTDI